MKVTVEALKKTRHGAYGKALATTTVEVPEDAREALIHELALADLKGLLPGIRITTNIVRRVP